MKINFLGLLAILFIGLKLTNYIDWSWWLILLPLYGVPAFVLGVGAIGVIAGIIILLIDKVKK